jgi:hypothetical protein
VIRVGQWWVCHLHEVWAENPADPGLAEEGKAALLVQQERAKSGAAGAGGAGAVSVPGPGAGTAPSGRAEAIRALDESLGGALTQAREERRRKIGERAVSVFSRAVRERRAAGVERDAAILSAVREVAVLAIEQHWGTGR